ncbi:MAG: methyltransferase domain-containing protein [Anaerolineae bacterium]|nr:methyltransferase domain-containing protein [Anaerolineae bacterium]
MSDKAQRICDYEGSTYRTDFWEGQGRNYEDLVERQVLRQLLPAQGKRLLEIGAGFGRITEEYGNYEHVVLLDYSFSQLQYARERLGDDGYTYVAADAYQLPFKAGVFDGATMIRVIHHFENVPKVLSGIRHVLANEACFILEHANKRNLKALLRHRIGKQAWNPNTLDSVEFVELNFNFHPDYIERELKTAEFEMQERIPVSFFRLGLLKRTIPVGVLVGLDTMLQKTGWLIAPSIFTKNQAIGSGADNLIVESDDIFACPQTGGELHREGNHFINATGTRWEIRDGIYDFKDPV